MPNSNQTSLLIKNYIFSIHNIFSTVDVLLLLFVDKSKEGYDHTKPSHNISELANP